MKNKLKITKPDKRKNKKELVELFAKSFPFPNYFEMHGEGLKRYFYNSHYDWETSRIGIIDDKIISHFGIWDYTTRIGSAQLRVAGIGAVITHGDFRKKGYLTKTALQSIEAAKVAGYDLSVLFGIPNFYHKLGYSRAWSHSSYKISLENLPKENPNKPFKKLKISQTEEIAKLYNSENKFLTGTAVRPTFKYYNPKLKGYYWENDKGSIAGYVFIKMENEKFECVEAVGNVDQIFKTLVSLARKNCYRNIEFNYLHYESALCKVLRRKNCSFENQFYACAGPMIRIINLESTLEKMCNEFSRKIKLSSLSNWSGTLLISDSNEKVTLKICNGKVSINKNVKTKHSIKGDEKLAQLLFRTDEPLETAEAVGIKFSGDGKKLAKVLFPNGHPMLALRDGF